MLKINPEAISGSFKPAIKSAIADLNDAQIAINSMQMPSDFSYGGKIKSISGEIVGVISQIKNVESGVNSEVENAIQTENENKSLVESLLGNTMDFGSKIGASAANAVMGYYKGILNIGEAIVDMASISLAANATIYTGAADVVSYLYNKLSGTDEEWESITAKMWKGVAGFVAEDYVNLAFEKIYNDTSAGKWLDENAYGPFKSDGMATNVVSGVGEVIGTVAISILTAGIGGAAVGISSATATGIAGGVVGAGKAAEKYWGDKVANSWEGIEKEYKRGNISKEEYNSMKEIREGMTEKDIDDLLKNGNITKEEADSYKKIVNMPEGLTNEDIGKGLVYSIGTGVWEGVQWYAGGKLSGWKGLTNSKLATSAIRVGADTGFNALDTPYRTMLEAATTDKTLKEAWKNQGGWSSVLSDTAIGLVGSVGGEIFDNFKNGTVKNEVFARNETDNFAEAREFICKKYNLDSKTISNEDVVDLANKLSETDKMNFEKIIDKELAKTLSVGEEKLQKVISKHTELGEEVSDSVREMLIFQNYKKNINLEKMTDIEIESYISIYKKVAEEKSIYKNYFKNKKYSFVSEDKISDAFNKVLILDEKEFKDFLVKKRGYTPKEASLINGIHNKSGITTNISNIENGAVTHEVNHDLGDVLNGNTEKYRAINEAFTQSITWKINPTMTKPTGYDAIGIVDTIDQLTQMLEYVGYENIDLVTYFGTPHNYYQEVVDGIAGDGFYDALANAMKKAHDGYLKDYDNIKILEGQQEMKGLLNYFGNIISKLK